MDRHGFFKQLYLEAKDLSDEYVRRAKLLLTVAETEAASWSTWFSMPLSTRLWLWRHGFHSPELVLHDFETYTPDDYISGVQRRFSVQINEPWNVMAGNKLAWYWMLEPFSEHRMEVHGIVDQHRFHPVGELQVGESPSKIISTADPIPTQQWVVDKLREDNAIVLKSATGSGGKSVVACEFDGTDFFWNGDKTSEDDLRERVSELSHHLVCEYIEQAEFAADLYPNAVSTFRVLTCWDETTEEVFIPIAVYRIATDMSAPVDNWTAGGLSAKIDIETGTLGPGVRYPFSKTLNWFAEHPDTGAQIEGRSIPRWESLRERLLDIAAAYSHLPYLGWDIVPTSDGGFTIIEANDCPGVNSLQVHQPLLADDRTRRFYEHHGIA